MTLWGAEHPQAVLSDDEIVEVRALHAAMPKLGDGRVMYGTNKLLARRFNVSVHYIEQITSGRRRLTRRD